MVARMVNQYAFLVNSDACSGCKTCQVACKDKNDLPVGLHWRRVFEVTAGDWQQRDAAWVTTVVAYNVSATCHHCLNPACIPCCPTEAIAKTETGIVLIDESACRNCHACELACPYGAIQFNPARNTTMKCDFCVDLLDMGQPPACVAGCPNRALDFGDLSDLRRRHPDGVAQVFPLPPASPTLPAVVILPHRNARLLQGLSPEVANREEV
jgi:anaerobic dimethyl sulfoxide reductase subunit B (iron-sulfur subunit)